jgi:DnaJ-class molecular chaperone
MSYEGYEDWYCENGHYVKTVDAMEFADPEGVKCRVCGSKVILIDFVDLTNGCFCASLPEGERCPAHPSVADENEGYDFATCEACGGTGRVPAKVLVITACECGGESGEHDPTCNECFGTGFVYSIERDARARAQVQCNYCKGRGKIAVPRYDVSRLRPMHGKSRFDIE